MSLGRKHSLREKVLIRGAIKAHNERGKLQRSLSLGAVPTRTSAFGSTPPALVHHPASVPLTMSEMRQREGQQDNDGDEDVEPDSRASQPSSYFGGHGLDESSSSDDEDPDEDIDNDNIVSSRCCEL